MVTRLHALVIRVDRDVMDVNGHEATCPVIRVGRDVMDVNGH